MKLYSYLTVPFLQACLGEQDKVLRINSPESFMMNKHEMDLFLLSWEDYERQSEFWDKNLTFPLITVLIFKEILHPKGKVDHLPSGTVVLSLDWPSWLQEQLLHSLMIYADSARQTWCQANQQLGPLVDKLQKELHKTKKFHEFFLPKRFGKIKGLKIATKYDAGGSSGGEFFDIYKEQNKVLMLMSSCRSYLSSSMVLQHFAQFQKKADISSAGLDRFERQLFTDLKAAGLDPFLPKEKVELMLVILDLKKLNAEFRLYGNFLVSFKDRLFSMGNGFEFCPEFSLKVSTKVNLPPGERIYVLSPGLRRNIKDQLADSTIQDAIFSLRNRTPIDSINEIFLEIHRLKNGEYLEHDSAAMVMEIDENVVYEV